MCPKTQQNNATGHRQILAIALPAIAANVATPLLSLVDTGIAGHLGSAKTIAAIAVGASMFNMLYWLMGFLRMGTSGLTSQANGKKDIAACRIWLMRALAIGVPAGMLMIVFADPLASMCLHIIEAPADVAVYARQYFAICIFGAPAMLSTYALTGWFLGMQTTRPVMVISLLVNAFNIGLSYLLAVICGHGLNGVAYGTAISQWLAAAFALSVAMRRFGAFSDIRTTFGHIFDIVGLKKLFSINTDIFFRTLCLICVTVYFTRQGALQGTSVLAANAIIMQLFMIFSFFMDGFAFAGEAIGGRLYGAGDIKGLRQCIKLLMKWGICLSMLAMAVYFVFGSDILSLLTDDTDTLATAHDYRLWAVLFPACGFMAFVWDGIFIGMTQTRMMLLAMAIAMAVFYCIYLPLSPKMGNNALWLAFNCYLLTRGVTQSVVFRHILKKACEKPIRPGLP